MARVSATEERRTTPTPYVELDRRAWSRLRENHPMSLEQSDLARLRGLGERLDLTEVEEVYLPLSRLLHFYVEATHGLRLATSEFLGERPSWAELLALALVLGSLASVLSPGRAARG